MSVKLMSRNKTGTPYERGWIYEAQDSVNTNTTAGTSIVLPAGIGNPVATVEIGTGAEVKLQTSTDLIDDILSEDSGVTWIDADSGSITTNFQDEFSNGVAAIRMYCIAAGSTPSTLKISGKQK